jgi:voltage-gated sodium channel
MLAAFNVSKLLNERMNSLRAEANLTIEGSSKKRQQLVKQVFQAQRKLENLEYQNEYPPLKQYLMFANVCDIIAKSSFCNNWILICIILAGLLVGLQTYPQLETNVGVNIVDSIVLWSFTGELVLKIFAEGKGPQFFFVGDEWKWNLFDFAIVLFSLPNIVPVDGSSVKLLRLVRLMRLAKVFRKIPQLQMIIGGLAGGMSSIIYIVILMLLCFYIFAIAGILFLKQNDPWHWRSIEICFMSLLRIATLDGWGDMFYISYYGCDVYDGGFYTMDPLEASDVVGGLQLCDAPMASPVFACIFYLLFIVLNAFCILSLFIGAVSTAMAEAMVQMKFDQEAARIEEEKQKVNEIAELYKDRTKLDRKTKRRILLMELAFTGQAIEDKKEIVEVNWSDPLSYYKALAYYAELFAENSYFQQFVTLIIVCAGVTVGMNTNLHIATDYASELIIADQVILYVFVVEMVVKIVAEGVSPLKYFKDGWNCFDFIVVVGSFLPTGSGSLITILRLLRLLRVLKLMKALPQLQVIVAALMEGMSSVFFISVLLFMFFYFFAVIGVTFFSQNDVWHFGTLHLALAMLFDAATLDNWTTYLYINMYGCEQFGYGTHSLTFLLTHLLTHLLTYLLTYLLE